MKEILWTGEPEKTFSDWRGCFDGWNPGYQSRTHALVALGAALITLIAVQLSSKGMAVDGNIVIRAIATIKFLLKPDQVSSQVPHF
jgi:hypothetical protein